MGSNQRSNSSNSSSRNYQHTNRNKHNKHTTSRWDPKHNTPRNYHHDSSRRNIDYPDNGNNRNRSSFQRDTDDYYQNQFSTYQSTNRNNQHWDSRSRPYQSYSWNNKESREYEQFQPKYIQQYPNDNRKFHLDEPTQHEDTFYMENDDTITKNTSQYKKNSKNHSSLPKDKTFSDSKTTEPSSSQQTYEQTYVPDSLTEQHMHSPENQMTNNINSDCNATTSSSTSQLQHLQTPVQLPHQPTKQVKERNAEQVTKKLINQLTSMDKHNLKQMIINPNTKYDTALQTHARKKIREEMRKQLRTMNLDQDLNLEPDECIDSDKLPDSMFEDIERVLNVNLLGTSSSLNIEDENYASGEKLLCPNDIFLQAQKLLMEDTLFLEDRSVDSLSESSCLTNQQDNNEKQSDEYLCEEVKPEISNPIEIPEDNNVTTTSSFLTLVPLNSLLEKVPPKEIESYKSMQPSSSADNHINDRLEQNTEFDKMLNNDNVQSVSSKNQTDTFSSYTSKYDNIPNEPVDSSLIFTQDKTTMDNETLPNSGTSKNNSLEFLNWSDEATGTNTEELNTPLPFTPIASEKLYLETENENDATSNIDQEVQLSINVESNRSESRTPTQTIILSEEINNYKKDSTAENATPLKKSSTTHSSGVSSRIIEQNTEEERCRTHIDTNFNKKDNNHSKKNVSKNDTMNKSITIIPSKEELPVSKQIDTSNVADIDKKKQIIDLKTKLRNLFEIKEKAVESKKNSDKQKNKKDKKKMKNLTKQRTDLIKKLEELERKKLLSPDTPSLKSTCLNKTTLSNSTNFSMIIEHCNKIEATANNNQYEKSVIESITPPQKQNEQTTKAELSTNTAITQQNSNEINDTISLHSSTTYIPTDDVSLFAAEDLPLVQATGEHNKDSPKPLSALPSDIIDENGAQEKQVETGFIQSYVGDLPVQDPDASVAETKHDVILSKGTENADRSPLNSNLLHTTCLSAAANTSIKQNEDSKVVKIIVNKPIQTVEEIMEKSAVITSNQRVPEKDINSLQILEAKPPIDVKQNKETKTNQNNKKESSAPPSKLPKIQQEVSSKKLDKNSSSRKREHKSENRRRSKSRERYHEKRTSSHSPSTKKHKQDKPYHHHHRRHNSHEKGQSSSSNISPSPTNVSPPNEVLRTWRSPGEKKCIEPILSVPSTDTYLLDSKWPKENDRATKQSDSTKDHVQASTTLSTEVATENREPSKVIMPLQDPMRFVTDSQQLGNNDLIMNRMKDIDEEYNHLQKRKMVIEETILKLQKEKMEIDNLTMQFQNERFLLLGSLLSNNGNQQRNVSATIATSSTPITAEPKIQKVQLPRNESKKRFLEPEAVHEENKSAVIARGAVNNQEKKSSKKNVLVKKKSTIDKSGEKKQSLPQSSKKEDIKINDQQNEVKTSLSVEGVLPLLPLPVPDSSIKKPKANLVESNKEQAKDLLETDKNNFEANKSEPRNNVPSTISAETSKNDQDNDKLFRNVPTDWKSKNCKVVLARMNINSYIVKKQKCKRNNKDPSISVQLTKESKSPIDVINSNAIVSPTPHFDGYFIRHRCPIIALKIIETNLFAASEDGNIYKYHLDSGNLEHTFSLHNKPVTGISNIDSSYMLSISLDGFLKKCHLNDYQAEVSTFNLGEPLQVLEHYLDKAYIGTRSGKIFVYDSKTNTVDEDYLCSLGKSIMVIICAKEGPRNVLIVSSRSNHITIRDELTGLLLRTIEVPHKITIYSMLLDGNVLFCGTNQNTILKFNFTNGELNDQVKCGIGTICIKLYKQSIVLSGSYDGNIYAFDKLNNTNIMAIHGPGKMLLQFDVIDNKIIASSKNKKKDLRIWDIPDELKHYRSKNDSNN